MKKIIYVAVIIAMFGGVEIAEAQQPTKIPRIGYLLSKAKECTRIQKYFQSY